MKKVAILVCIVSLLSVSACSITKYDKEIHSAMKALQEDQYGNALTYLMEAEKEHSTAEVKTYIDETKHIQSSVQAIEQGDYNGAAAAAEQIVNAKDSTEYTEVLKEKANRMITKVNQWNSQQKEMQDKLTKAQALANEKKFEEAEAILKELSNTASQSEQIKAIAKQANQLCQVIDQEKQNSTHAQTSSASQVVK